MALKLGKLPHVPDERDLRLAAYAIPTELPTPPKEIGYLSNRLRWGVLGNDEYGDCVFAGAAHETKLLNSLHHRSVSFNTPGVLADYAAVTGFDPSDPSTDQGTVVRTALNYRRKTGVIDTRKHRHKIGAYVALDPKNLNQLDIALYLFGFVGIGVEFPDTAFTQFDNGEAWEVVPGAKIEGGHYVPVVAKKRDGNYRVVTWGKGQDVTPAFLVEYMDEAWAALSPELLASGRSPQGFDNAQLTEDLRALSRKGVQQMPSTQKPGGPLLGLIDALSALLLVLVPARFRPFAKAITPASLAVIAVIVQWVSSGSYNGPELATTLTGLLGSIVTFLTPNRAALK